MSSVQRIAVLIVGLAMLTTVSLPNRQFPQVVTAVGNAFRGVLGTAMGTARPS